MVQPGGFQVSDPQLLSGSPPKRSASNNRGPQNDPFLEESPDVIRGAQQRSQSQAHGPKKVVSGFFLHKVVIMTGASSGIGRSLAHWYLNNGARVVLIGRDIIELDRIAKQYPSQSLAIQAELTND